MQRLQAITATLKQSPLIGIVVVLLLATAMRLTNVNGWPVWTDEGWSIWATNNPRFEVVIERLEQDRHPPAYFLALAAWRTVAGDSRLSLRFLSIAGGLLTVAIAYRIGKDLFDHRAGFFAALFFAVLSLPIYYSQEVRHYGWLTLSVSLMALFFMRYLHRPRLNLLIAYALSVAFMLYTQYLGIAVLIMQIAFGLILWRGSQQAKLHIIGAWLLAFLLYIPWLVIMTKHLTSLIGNQGLNNYAELYHSTLVNLIYVPDILYDGQLGFLGTGYVLGAVVLIRRRQKSGILYAVWGGLGLFLMVFAFNLRVGLLAPRGMIFLLPLLVVVSGIGIATIQSERLRWLLVVIAIFAILSRQSITQPRIDTELVATTAAELISAQDLVVLEMDWDNYALEYELKRQRVQGDLFLTWQLPNSPNTLLSLPLSPVSILANYQRVWVVQWLQPPATLDLLNSGFEDFHEALLFDVPLGDEFGTRFDDRTATLALFERARLDTVIARFGGTFALHTLITDGTVTAGEHIFVDLWWSSLQTSPLDYSAGVYLLDDTGTIRAQHDGALGIQPTSLWTPNTLVFNRHLLQVPADLPSGIYQIAISVYWYGDLQNLRVNGAPYMTIGTVTIQ